MKHFIAFAIFVLASICQLAVPCHAEKTAAKKFPAERVSKEAALYVESLNLKGDDAQKFTKLYIEYRRKIHNAVEKNRPPYKDEYSKLSDDQNDKNIRSRFASSRAILEIREQYYPKFLKIITPTQYEKFTKLEQRLFEKSKHEHQRRKSSNSTTSSKGKNTKTTTVKRVEGKLCDDKNAKLESLSDVKLKMKRVTEQKREMRKRYLEVERQHSELKREMEKLRLEMKDLSNTSII
ncbi:MAG: hypothetical protein HDS83_03785 [Bacteroidales bacterium]|nr:hypothetical protein [Bacteroidales bacterium]